MVNRPRNIGTAGESAVVKILQTHGWPHAERRQLRGHLDCGDITGTPGVVWEIKAGAKARNASDLQTAVWLKQTERERQNANADIGVLVMVRKGIGAPNAGRWWAAVTMHTLAQLMPAFLPPPQPSSAVLMHLTTMCHLLNRAGYGDPR